MGFPKSKVPGRDDEFISKLADLITTAYIKPCQLSDILGEYQILSNCEVWLFTLASIFYSIQNDIDIPRNVISRQRGIGNEMEYLSWIVKLTVEFC